MHRPECLQFVSSLGGVLTRGDRDTRTIFCSNADLADLRPDVDSVASGGLRRQVLADSCVAIPSYAPDTMGGSRLAIGSSIQEASIVQNAHSQFRCDFNIVWK